MGASVALAGDTVRLDITPASGDEPVTSLYVPSGRRRSKRRFACGCDAARLDPRVVTHAACVVGAPSFDPRTTRSARRCRSVYQAAMYAGGRQFFTSAPCTCRDESALVVGAPPHRSLAVQSRSHKNVLGEQHNSSKSQSTPFHQPTHQHKTKPNNDVLFPAQKCLQQ
jgi:hypothetical protein